MSDGDFLWQTLTVLLTVGNVALVWSRLKLGSKPSKVKVHDQPLEIVHGHTPATMDHIQRLEKRIDDQIDRIEKLERVHRSDKKDIIDEIIRMREQSAKQYQEISRAIGRLEGAQLGN